VKDGSKYSSVKLLRFLMPGLAASLLISKGYEEVE
jgi:hypothetical protein